MTRRTPTKRTKKVPSEPEHSIIQFPLQNPFQLYDMTQLAAVMGVSHRYVKTIKEAGAPFAYGRTRPEWVLEWLRERAHDKAFQDGKLCA